METTMDKNDFLAWPSYKINFSVVSLHGAYTSSSKKNLAKLKPGLNKSIYSIPGNIYNLRWFLWKMCLTFHGEHIILGKLSSSAFCLNTIECCHIYTSS